MQELSAEQAEALAAVLPCGQLEPAADYTGMGVATRRPAAVGRLPLRYRPLRTAALDPADWPGVREPLAVWNVHIRAPHSGPPWSFAIRRVQLRQLLIHLQEPGRPCLVLVGDLNATPIWPFYRRLIGPLRDAAVEAAARRGERPPPTWAPWSGGAQQRRLLRIDHALVRGVEVAEVRRLHVPGSDHDALCVELSLD